MKKCKLTNEQTGSVCAALQKLVCAGIAPADALVLLAQDEKDAALAKLLMQMSRQVDEGVALSVAMQSSGSFAPYVSSLLQVAERSGKQEQTLGALASYYDGRAKMERQLRTALLYPGMLLAVLFAVLVVLLVWVLPVFNDVYAQLGSHLTGFAGGLLRLGEILRMLLPWLCTGVALLVLVSMLPQVRSHQQKLRHDRGAYKKVCSARYVQAVALAVASGMAHKEAARLACRLSDGENDAFRRRCEGCAEDVEKGTAFSHALHKWEFIDASSRRLLDAGIRGGSEETVLQELSRQLLEQGEEALQQRAARIEPCLVAVSCLLIGGVLLSVMLPLMHIMTAIG